MPRILERAGSSGIRTPRTSVWSEIRHETGAPGMRKVSTVCFIPASSRACVSRLICDCMPPIASNFTGHEDSASCGQ